MKIWLVDKSSFGCLKILQQLKTESGDSKWLFPSPDSDKHITPEAIDHAIRKNEDAFKKTFNTLLPTI